MFGRVCRKLLSTTKTKKRSGSDCVNLLDAQTKSERTSCPTDMEKSIDHCDDENKSVDRKSMYIIVPYNPAAIRKLANRRCGLVVDKDCESDIRLIKDIYLIKQLYICGLV